MKKAAGSIRIDLAQFREMEVFTQFSSDLDEDTKQQLRYGNGLMQLLKQPNNHPLTMSEQVVTLCVAMNKLFLSVPLNEVKAYQGKLLDYFHEEHSDILDTLEQTKVLTDDLVQEIVSAAIAFKGR